MYSIYFSYLDFHYLNHDITVYGGISLFYSDPFFFFLFPHMHFRISEEREANDVIAS